jgi:hypothetical protein
VAPNTPHDRGSVKPIDVLPPGVDIGQRTELNLDVEVRMPDEQQTNQRTSPRGTTVWLVLDIGQANGDVAGFWEQADAVARQAALLAASPHDLVLVREVVVQGGRRRCRLCGEPVVLDDTCDPESWRHADDANDLGDHTAEL